MLYEVVFVATIIVHTCPRVTPLAILTKGKAIHKFIKMGLRIVARDLLLLLFFIFFANKQVISSPYMYFLSAFCLSLWPSIALSGKALRRV